LNLIKKYISDHKLDIIFHRLIFFIQKETTNYEKYRPLIEDFKNFIKQDIPENKICEKLEDLGKICVKQNLIYEESLSIIDFLRLNTIAHLPNDLDLRIAKKFERFFKFMESCFSKGYLNEKIYRDYENFKNFKKFLEEKNLDSELFYYFNLHLEYYLQLLECIKTKKFCLLKNTEYCEFGVWLRERKSDLLKEEKHIVNDLLQYHENFHKLILLIEQAYNRKNYKKTILLLRDLENHVLWIGNKISILNNLLTLKKMSRDPLTDLLTRQNLELIIEKQLDIVRVTGGKISLMFIDIDNFKHINDTYGHIAGDIVLKKIAQIIKSSIRKSDYAFRYGGEEFLVVLPFTSKDEALLVAEKIRKKIEKTVIKYNKHLLKITVSIGVSEYDPHKTLKENLEIVDKKLYEAKRSGKNKVVI